MAGHLVLIWISDVEVLGESVDELSSEDTSALSETGRHFLGTFGKAHEVILGADVSSASAAAKLGARATRVDELEVELGRGFSLKGKMIVVGSSAEAMLTYDAPVRD